MTATPSAAGMNTASMDAVQSDVGEAENFAGVGVRQFRGSNPGSPISPRGVISPSEAAFVTSPSSEWFPQNEEMPTFVTNTRLSCGRFPRFDKSGVYEPDKRNIAQSPTPIFMRVPSSMSASSVPTPTGTTTRAAARSPNNLFTSGSSPVAEMAKSSSNLALRSSPLSSTHSLVPTQFSDEQRGREMSPHRSMTRPGYPSHAAFPMDKLQTRVGRNLAPPRSSSVDDVPPANRQQSAGAPQTGPSPLTRSSQPDVSVPLSSAAPPFAVPEPQPTNSWDSTTPSTRSIKTPATSLGSLPLAEKGADPATSPSDGHASQETLDFYPLTGSQRGIGLGDMDASQRQSGLDALDDFLWRNSALYSASEAPSFDDQSRYSSASHVRSRLQSFAPKANVSDRSNRRSVVSLAKAQHSSMQVVDLDEDSLTVPGTSASSRSSTLRKGVEDTRTPEAQAAASAQDAIAALSLNSDMYSGGEVTSDSAHSPQVFAARDSRGARPSDTNTFSSLDDLLAGNISAIPLQGSGFAAGANAPRTQTSSVSSEQTSVPLREFGRDQEGPTDPPTDNAHAGGVSLPQGASEHASAPPLPSINIVPLHGGKERLRDASPAARSESPMLRKTEAQDTAALHGFYEGMPQAESGIPLVPLEGINLSSFPDKNAAIPSLSLSKRREAPSNTEPPAHTRLQALAPVPLQMPDPSVNDPIGLETVSIRTGGSTPLHSPIASNTPRDTSPLAMRSCGRPDADTGSVSARTIMRGRKNLSCRRCEGLLGRYGVRSTDDMLDGIYHRECFTCVVCDARFEDGAFYVFEGEPHCHLHYHERCGTLCAACGKGIEGVYRKTDASTSFHLQCLSCDYRDSTTNECCAQELADFFLIGNGRYCERHARIVAQEPPQRRSFSTHGDVQPATSLSSMVIPAL